LLLLCAVAVGAGAVAVLIVVVAAIVVAVIVAAVVDAAAVVGVDVIDSVASGIDVDNNLHSHSGLKNFWLNCAEVLIGFFACVQFVQSYNIGS